MKQGLLRKALVLFWGFIALTVCSVAYADWSSDYRYWSQNQTTYVDRSVYAMGDYGCAIVARARMLYEMGVNRESSFNPDRYMEWENSKKIYFQNLSHIETNNWTGPSAYAEERGCSVTTYDEDWPTTDSQLWFNINAGYWTILKVSGPHYVLVDNETSKRTGQLYIYESSWDGSITGPTLLSSRNYYREDSVVYCLNSVAPSNHLPVGQIDDIHSNGNGTIHFYGWTYDPDEESNNNIELDIYLGADGYHGGKRYVAYTNGVQRTDVGHGNYHGFEFDLTVNERGNQPIYIYAIDTSDLHKNTLIYSGAVNIQDITPTAIALNQNIAGVAPKQDAWLRVVFTPSNTHDDYRGIIWSSSDETVARVSINGTVSAVSEGTAVITATSKYNPNLKATCTVTVNSGIPKPEWVSIDVDDDYVVHFVWKETPLIDQNDVRVYRLEISYRGLHRLETVSDLTNTYYDYQAMPRSNSDYEVYLYAINKNTGQTSWVGKMFYVDWILKQEWQTASYLPSIVTEELCQIEYQHTYRKTSNSSPGSGWSLVPGTTNEWQKTGDWTTTKDSSAYSILYRFRLKDTGHTLTKISKIEPTCTEPGIEAYWKCTECGKCFSDRYGVNQISSPTTIGALGHDYIHHEAQAPTCTEIGWDAYDTCSRCDFTTYVEKAALGHNWGPVEYEWVNDNSSVVATMICKNDSTHVATESANVTTTITSPTEDTEGAVTYISDEFLMEEFTVQTMSMTIPALKDMNVIRLPELLTILEDESFENIACEAILIPQNCASVGNYAFRNCKMLKYVRVPISIEIASDAFEGCGNVVIDRVSE